MTRDSRVPVSTRSMLRVAESRRGRARRTLVEAVRHRRAAVVRDEAPSVKGAVLRHARTQSKHGVVVAVARQEQTAARLVGVSALDAPHPQLARRPRPDRRRVGAHRGQQPFHQLRFGPLREAVVVQVTDGVVRFFCSIAEHVPRAPGGSSAARIRRSFATSSDESKSRRMTGF